MKRIHGIKDEDKEELREYINLIQQHGEMQNEQVARFDKAKRCTEILSGAWKRLSALNLDQMDPAILRNAEMMTHFMNECREADKLAALHANIVQAMKEALTLLLAEKYHINIENEWHLDLDKGIIVYGDPTQVPQD